MKAAAPDFIRDTVNVSWQYTELNSALYIPEIWDTQQEILCEYGKTKQNKTVQAEGSRYKQQQETAANDVVFSCCLSVYICQCVFRRWKMRSVSTGQVLVSEQQDHR